MSREGVPGGSGASGVSRCEETQTTEVHRVTLLVIDHDGLGADGVRGVIEFVRYPNRCIHPSVKGIETRVVEFHDQHPLNLHSTSEAAYRELFEPATARGEDDHSAEADVLVALANAREQIVEAFEERELLRERVVELEALLLEAELGDDDL